MVLKLGIASQTFGTLTGMEIRQLKNQLITLVLS